MFPSMVVVVVSGGGRCYVGLLGESGGILDLYVAIAERFSNFLPSLSLYLQLERFINKNRHSIPDRELNFL